MTKSVEKKGLFNVVDILVLLIIVSGIAGFAYKVTVGDSALGIKSDTPINVEFEIVGLRQFAVDAIDIGDSLYEKAGIRLGTVSGIRIEPQRLPVELLDGSQVLGEVQGRYNLYITIAAQGRVNDTGHYIGGVRLVAPGSELKLNTNRLNTSGIVRYVAPDSALNSVQK